MRLFGLNFLSNIPWALLTFHLVPRPEYINVQFIGLGIPLFWASLTWIGYMAVEPYARRSWPKLMVSWQRLLSGRFRDPLVGRDVLLGGLAGSAVGVVLIGANALIGISEMFTVSHFFGKGLGPSLGWVIGLPTQTCGAVLAYLAMLTIMTAILRRKWLGIAATGLLLIPIVAGPVNAVDFALSVLFVGVFLAVLTRVGLVGAASFYIVWSTLAASPPWCSPSGTPAAP